MPVLNAVAGGWVDAQLGIIFAQSYGNPITVRSLQSALDDMGNAGGGRVIIPSDANIPITDTSVKIPNRVLLLGTADHTSNPTFICSAATNVSAVIENKTQDGTQQYASIQNIQINGFRTSGALVTTGILLKSVYAGSFIRDVVVSNCSGNGITLDGGASAGIGQMWLSNVAITRSGDHQLLITGPADSIHGYLITCETVDAGKAQIKITNATGTASGGHAFFGIHFEGTAAYDGLVLDGCFGVVVDSLTDNGSGAANNAVKITSVAGGSDGAFAAGGHTLRNINANLTTIIDDQVAGVTVGNAQGRFVRYYSSPVSSATLDKSQMIGIQSARAGVSAVATGTMSIGDGNYFVISGATQITNINTALRDAGRCVTLTFSGTPIVATGGNLKLNSQFTAAANSVLQLVSDGTNWWGGRLS